MESKVWDGKNYLLFHEAAINKKSDTILANQLAGQWCSRLHGLPGAVPETRVSHRHCVLRRATCAPATANGALNSLRPDGSSDHSAPPHSDGIFTGECLCLAATRIYEGRRLAGEEVAPRIMSQLS